MLGCGWGVGVSLGFFLFFPFLRSLWFFFPLLQLSSLPLRPSPSSLSPLLLTPSPHRSIPILLLISRSKLVPDFALTLHFLHLIATSLYSRALPRNWLWWLLQAASSALMIGLGVWACRWRELRPISFRGKRGGEEEGGARGEYEMVGMKGGT